MDPHYTFAFRTYADTVPNPDITGLYWYDSGATCNSEKVYYDASGTYAKWYSTEEPANFVITLKTEVGDALSNFFIEGVSDTWTGNGSWSGVAYTTSVVISDAWYRAETTVFNSLKSFVGGTEGNDCFRGFLPVLKYVNVWQLSSGSSSEMQMERLAGNNPAWCSMRVDAHIESVWQSREEAMKFAGAVQAWLKQNTNLNKTDNVTWCCLSEVPDEPQIYRTNGTNRQTYWKMMLDLEIVYMTEGTY